MAIPRSTGARIMTVRSDQKSAFLQECGWSAAQVIPIAGDASARSYQRLIHRELARSAILMDAPPRLTGTMQPFVDVATYLEQAGLSAPSVIAHNLEHGFLLLEDLGDAVFTNVITKNPMAEQQLYEAATDVITCLHQEPNDALPVYGAAQMADATDLAFLYYRRNPTSTLDEQAKDVISELNQSLSNLCGFTSVSLRDFHAENLIWLPERFGVARVGLLDFQDAVLTHPSYDLMSLVRDARRDIVDDLADHLIGRFCKQNEYDEASFRAEAALISAQRNLRILGIFARLSRVYGKPHYVDLIPRVWDNLQKDLAHSSLNTLRDILTKALPQPTPEFLIELREPCRTPQ